MERLASTMNLKCLESNASLSKLLNCIHWEESPHLVAQCLGSSPPRMKLNSHLETVRGSLFKAPAIWTRFLIIQELDLQLFYLDPRQRAFANQISWSSTFM